MMTKLELPEGDQRIVYLSTAMSCVSAVRLRRRQKRGMVSGGERRLPRTYV